VHKGGIKPELKLATNVTAQSFVRIKLAIAQWQLKSPVQLVWHKGLRDDKGINFAQYFQIRAGCARRSSSR
jgi:hypothetical protein